MSRAFLIWLEFSVCAALITLAGWRLALYGDVIAEKTGLGGTWISALLLGVYLANAYVQFRFGG